MDTQRIIQLCGGPTFVAYNIGRTENAVRSWYKHGIPDRYWPWIVKRAGISADALLAANTLVRNGGRRNGKRYIASR